MARIAVTGAAGSVGRSTLDAFEDTDHEVKAITHRERDIDSVVLDIGDREAVREAVDDCDAVVHLAGNPSPHADWESVLEVNIDGTNSVFESAVARDVDRVVFASSNHAQGMYNTPRPEDAMATVDSPHAVYPDDPARPDSYYGVSKVAGEALGSYYADRHGLEVVNARIGWLTTAEALRNREFDEESHVRHAKALWLSPRDWQQFVRGAVSADLPKKAVTLNAVSNNELNYFSLMSARRAIGYHPVDDSADVLE